MSQVEENVELLRRGFGQFSAGDLDAAAATLHPEVEWHLTFRLPDLPGGKLVYRGPAEVLQVWEAFKSVWDELVIHIEEILHVDAERIVARARFRGRGAASGIDVDRVVFYVARITDGKLAYLKAHDAEIAARAEAGIGDG